MKIIDMLTRLGSKRMHIYEDDVTEKMPYLAVSIIVGMIIYVAFDYFMVIR